MEICAGSGQEFLLIWMTSYPLVPDIPNNTNVKERSRIGTGRPYNIVEVTAKFAPFCDKMNSGNEIVDTRITHTFLDFLARDSRFSIDLQNGGEFRQFIAESPSSGV